MANYQALKTDTMKAKWNGKISVNNTRTYPKTTKRKKK